VRLISIDFHSIPNYDMGGGCDPYYIITKLVTKEEVFDSRCGSATYTWQCNAHLECNAHLAMQRTPGVQRQHRPTWYNGLSCNRRTIRVLPIRPVLEGYSRIRHPARSTPLEPVPAGTQDCLRSTVTPSARVAAVLAGTLGLWLLAVLYVGAVRARGRTLQKPVHLKSTLATINLACARVDKLVLCGDIKVHTAPHSTAPHARTRECAPASSQRKHARTHELARTHARAHAQLRTLGRTFGLRADDVLRL
jgi:hypothetical protein